MILLYREFSHCVSGVLLYFLYLFAVPFLCIACYVKCIRYIIAYFNSSLKFNVTLLTNMFSKVCILVKNNY